MPSDARGIPDDLPEAARAYQGFEGRVGRTFAGSESWWPQRPQAPEGPQRRRRAGRRPRLRRPRLLRLGDRHAPTSTGWPPAGCSSRTSTSRRCARRPGPRCSPGGTPTRPASGTSPTPTPASPATPRSWPTTSPRRRDAPRQRLRHAHGRQVAPHQGHRPVRRRAPSTRGRCQRGFDRYYGFLDAFTNLHHPHRLVEDNHRRDPTSTPTATTSPTT